VNSRPYIALSPILLLVFNRPDKTSRVFDAIKAAKPGRLYISADGPRQGNSEDERLCNTVRSIVTGVDWPCRVKTRFSLENKGCKMAVSSAIDWFFEQESEGIILEDDCLPSPAFFNFCDVLLEKFRTDTRIFCISGFNAYQGQQWGNASYYFSQICNIWGWATWRRVWKLYDRELSRYSNEDALHFLQNNFQDKLLIDEWLKIFNLSKEGKTDTWDHQFYFIIFFENGLCIVPNVNLIRNIGFGADATHTNDPESPIANLEFGEPRSIIIHPLLIVPDKQADYFLLNREFRLDEKRQKTEMDQLPRRRFKKWLNQLFKKDNS
jgi:hypothetical protein